MAKEPTVLSGATFTTMPARDRIQYPALLIKGAAPNKGSTFRVEADGVTYEGKVAGIVDRDGQTIVETSGLTPVLPEAEAPPEATAPPAA